MKNIKELKAYIDSYRQLFLDRNMIKNKYDGYSNPPEQRQKLDIFAYNVSLFIITDKTELIMSCKDILFFYISYDRFLCIKMKNGKFEIDLNKNSII